MIRLVLIKISILTTCVNLLINILSLIIAVSFLQKKTTNKNN